jgi:Cupin-like domain
MLEPTTLTVIPKVVAPTDERFAREYVAASRPVVLTGLLDDDALRAMLDLTRLRSEYGAAAVPIARVRDRTLVVDPARGITQDPAPLGEFLDALTAGASRGYLMARTDQLPPGLRSALVTPRYCVGAPWRVSKLWIASDETRSALHRDLADNLHTVVDGEKVFTLVSPAQSDRVYPLGLLDGLPNGARLDLDQPDYERFPRASALQTLTVRLRPGETLFLPHGWWHQVRTARGSISINTWWARLNQSASATRGSRRPRAHQVLIEMLPRAVRT